MTLQIELTLCTFGTRILSLMLNNVSSVYKLIQCVQPFFLKLILLRTCFNVMLKHFNITIINIF